MISPDKISLVYEAGLSSAFFILLWIVLGNGVFKPLLRNLEAREDNTKGAEERARKARDDAKDLQQKLADQRRRARLKGVSVRDKLIRQAQAEGKKLIEEASHKAEAETARGREDIAKSRVLAEGDLQRETDALARLLSAKVLEGGSDRVLQ